MKIMTSILPAVFTVLFAGDVFSQYICEGDCINGYGIKKVEKNTAHMKGQFVEGILREGTVVFLAE
mgnify:CR=1 FL=1